MDATRSLAVMQASKWLKVPVLLDGDEMAALLQALSHASIYQTSGLCPQGTGPIDPKDFLEAYRGYVASLKAGLIPDENLYRAYFSAVMTVTEDALFAVPVDETQQVIRVRRPVVQMQNHRFEYSEIDHQYRSMVYGMDSVLWGIQFSYPQLYQNPVTKDVEQVADTPSFPNTRLFRDLQKWVRDNTVATPIVAHNQRTNVPIRLGKACFPWINSHPQLIKKNLKVVDYANPQH